MAGVHRTTGPRLEQAWAVGWLGRQDHGNGGTRCDGRISSALWLLKPLHRPVLPARNTP